MSDAATSHRFREQAEALPTSRRDPNPWLALYLDSSLPMNPDAKAALVLDVKSRSRQFLLPLVRPLARTWLVIFQLLRFVLPSAIQSSKVLHRLIHWGLRHFVRPEANFLILRHFHIGTEILAFIRANTFPELPSQPLRPTRLEHVRDDLFLQHDINLFNFVIDLHRALGDRPLTQPPALDFSPITEGPFPIEPFPTGALNVIDVATAIELYTPLYELFLSDDDFWRASNSLQLDETLALYVAKLTGDATHLGLVNNRHPLVPLSTMRAGHRLMLHGLAAESLHGLLVHLKRQGTGYFSSPNPD